MLRFFNKLACRRSLIAGGVMALLLVAGLVRMTGWSAFAVGNSAGVIPAKTTGASKPSLAYARRMCAYCGVIASMREIEVSNDDPMYPAVAATGAGDTGNALVQPVRKYEIIVSMADGSSRVFEESISSTWRVGGRLIFIDAGNSPD